MAAPGFSPGRPGCRFTRLPRPEYSVSLQFGSAPSRADSLFRAVLSVIDSVKAGAIADADVQKIREQQLRTLEVNRQENSYWLSNLSARLENGEDPRGLLAYEQLIRGLSAAPPLTAMRNLPPRRSRRRAATSTRRAGQRLSLIHI